MAVIIIALFLLGLAAGSFVNALVWRLREQQNTKKTQSKPNLSIVNGRSMCPNCRHVLAWYDLIPIISWLALRGRCRYCGQAISIQYPLVELAGGVVFGGSYWFWPQTVHQNGQWILLAAWLAAFVGLLALAVCDLRWMLLPNKILYPALLVAVVGRVAYIAAYAPRKPHALAMWLGSVAIASGVFWLLYTISQGKWIGYGDVRLGLVTGTLLAYPGTSFLMIFLASALGSLSVVPELAKGQKTMASRLPYGPFLIAATVVCVVFGQSILDWYNHFFAL
ncbi:MAG TPA: prepilin peptidase [Candidatus Saccharimonadales bacterium]|nr:prepilin peptidase [Candidatus Saccharimonadales bacterium]